MADILRGEIYWADLEPAKTQENLIITRRGKPLACIIPYHDADMTPRPGKLANTLIFEEDIVSPLGKKMWDACQ